MKISSLRRVQITVPFNNNKLHTNSEVKNSTNGCVLCCCQLSLTILRMQTNKVSSVGSVGHIHGLGLVNGCF